jgi:hypothetical protein
VILGHHHVELAAPRPHEDGIAGPGAGGVDTRGASLLDRGQDGLHILATE